MILFDIETWPSWQNREKCTMYIFFPSMICPSDHEKIMEYLHFFLFNYPFNIFVYQARMILQNTKEVNSICQNHPIYFSCCIYHKSDTYHLHQFLYQWGHSWGHLPHWCPPASRFCTGSTWGARQWQTLWPGGSWSLWLWPRCHCGSWARWIFCSS